ncbi:MAG: formate/nitrite transporter family protein [Magnetococcales bacterium]|uniref:Formate/nitrite transporter family protein n=1 Tax=Candidatus Magnetobacterium casense TaxID=1455061 RepID=A0ABS6RYH6_9BACT|nr:formate/nitrite transporter family protein [Candidatus Magnetobacterium casensis]MBF0609250.1 formate/nitrite transporter family protein [Nitrospirota bacterium]MBV6341683.1 formate/nitrite transporter family protein [Candidatus Magnetobacterium casensis]
MATGKIVGSQPTVVDNLLPKEIALKAENVGVIKANLDWYTLMMLSIMAGAFIALGSAFFTTVITGNGAGGAIKLPGGILRLVGGLVFCLGLILVVIAGAELFTGNVLIIMAAASKKVSAKLVLRNWFIVYVGNFIGSIITAYLIYESGQFKLMDGLVGLKALEIADVKCNIPFWEGLLKGIYCNVLVCLAIWLCFSGRTVVDKISGIIFPITAFVAMGFEHCVANMYFIPLGIFIKSGADADFWLKAGKAAGDFANLTWGNLFIVNLSTVSLGNTLGGFMVGFMYWVVYNRSNLLNADNQQEVLKKLIEKGRRKHERFKMEGLISFNFDSNVVSGQLKDISEGGLFCVLHPVVELDRFGLRKEQGHLPRMLERVVFDIASGEQKVSGLTGIIIDVNMKDVNTTGVGRSIKFTDLTSEKNAELVAFVHSIKNQEQVKGG